MMDKKLEKYLKEHEIEYIPHKHKAVFSVSESEKIKKNIPGLHCKTLFLKDEKGKFYLLGMPAEKKLNSKRFIESQKIKKVRFASPEELKDKVNLIPGSVSIFGAIYIKDNVKLIIDSDVWNSETIGFHPNDNTCTLELKHKNLKSFYDSLNCEKEVVNL